MFPIVVFAYGLHNLLNKTIVFRDKFVRDKGTLVQVDELMKQGVESIGDDFG